MDCAICDNAFDPAEHLPLVLACGHTFCKKCLERLGAPLRCPLDGHIEHRLVPDLPTNFALVDAAHLDLTAAYKGLTLSASSSSGLFSSHEISRLWLDDQGLKLTCDVIGSGTTGQVVAGTYGGRAVAVKLVDLSNAPEASRQALKQEARVAMMVAGKCRHVCQYKGATIKGNKFCLIMERYSKSLADVIAESGAPPNSGLPLPRVERYASQALAALHELHSVGVVMADFKPQKLLLDEDLDELVLTDFGMSKILSRTLAGGKTSHVAPDTLMYMSPEQHCVDGFTSPPSPTPAADMWAWACTVIHMATGAAPFAGLSLGQIIGHVGVHKQTPVIPDSLPEPLKQQLSRCLSAEPGQRPSAMQVLKELQQASQQGPGLPVGHSLTPAVSAAILPAATVPTIQPIQQPGGIQLLQLVHELSSTDAGVQAAAAHELAYMALTGDAVAATRAEILATPSCLPSLVAKLSSSNAEVQQQAARVLAMLAGDVAASKAIAAEPGCLPCDTATRQDAIAAVPGCFEGLVALMGDNGEDVQAEAARAVCNLARRNQIAIAAVPGSLDKLVSLLSSSSVEVQVQAARALGNLACDNVFTQEAIAAVPGWLEGLAALLCSDCYRVQQESAGALVSLSTHHVANRAAIAALPGCLDRLMTLRG